MSDSPQPPWWTGSQPPSSPPRLSGFNGNTLDLGMMFGRALQKLEQIGEDVIWIKGRLAEGDDRMDRHETRISVLESKPAAPPSAPPPAIEWWAKVAAMIALPVATLLYTGSAEKAFEIAKAIRGLP